MFYIQVSLGPQKITVECKLWCQNGDFMYVVTRHWTTRMCCLLRGVVTNGMFYVLLYVLHVPTFLCEKLIRWSPPADEYLRYTPADGCIGLRIYVSTCGGVEQCIVLIRFRFMEVEVAKNIYICWWSAPVHYICILLKHTHTHTYAYTRTHKHTYTHTDTNRYTNTQRPHTCTYILPWGHFHIPLHLCKI